MSGGHQAAAGTAAGQKYVGTITQGNSPGVATGYSTLFSIGSRSPTTLSDGKTLADWYDAAIGSTGTLRISGFSADPGKSYFVDCTAHGTTRTSASSSYVYSAGAGVWSWASGTFGFATSGTTDAQIR